MPTCTCDYFGMFLLGMFAMIVLYFFAEILLPLIQSEPKVKYK